MKRKYKTAYFAVCIKNTGYAASLERGKIYRVLRDDEAAAEGQVRVVDESGEDYLYSAERFVEVQLPQAVKRSLFRAA